MTAGRATSCSLGRYRHGRASGNALALAEPFTQEVDEHAHPRHEMARARIDGVDSRVIVDNPIPQDRDEPSAREIILANFSTMSGATPAGA